VPDADESSDVDHLVTYGSLLRIFSMQERLGVDDRLEFERPCKVPGVMYDCGRYPGVVPGDGVVRGELYRMRDAGVLTAIDYYEGYDPTDESSSLFVRRPVDLIEPDGCTAWVYFYRGEGNGQAPNRSRVGSGDWAQYVQESEPASG
jgi:gamma-glutamylcyclotransferase (GGCT)/AIG2-like uncharacterized protein YtfP